jgi:hypothetical protein
LLQREPSLRDLKPFSKHNKHNRHKSIAVLLTAFTLLPSLENASNNFAMQRFAARDLGTGSINQTVETQVHTVRELAGDASLKSRAGHDFKVYRYLPHQVPENAATESYRFLVQGGLHGNEKLGSSFVLWLARRYGNGESLLNKLQTQGAAFDFLPYANPDGTHAHSRYNASGVNLNRNFGILWGLARENPGVDSFSEPETKAIRFLFKERKYTAAVDVHGYINWIVAPSAPEQVKLNGIKVSTAKKSEYSAWIDALKNEIKLLPNYQLQTAGGLGDGGAFEDWAFWSQGTFAYCMELISEKRFQTSYRRSFANITVEEKNTEIDTFLRYETFVFRMFENAIKIKKSTPVKAELAAD